MVILCADTKENLARPVRPPLSWWIASLNPSPDEIVIGAIDVGAPKNIGWAILFDGKEYSGRDLDEFIELFAELANGNPSALGFECPLFIPLHDELANLTRQRVGEAGRPWSAGAGATVTTIGLAIVSYTLRKLRERMPEATATQDWKAWPREKDLLVWEAFISGANHAGPGGHHLDAHMAATGFKLAINNLDSANAIQPVNVLSLAGACLARNGWGNPPSELSKPCLVIRPV